MSQQQVKKCPSGHVMIQTEACECYKDADIIICDWCDQRAFNDTVVWHCINHSNNPDKGCDECIECPLKHIRYRMMHGGSCTKYCITGVKCCNSKGIELKDLQ